MGATIVVVGANFAGLTAALVARKKLGHQHEIVVIGERDHFLFVPSLIWVPFGEREIEDITVPIRPVLESKGITFVHDQATRIDPEAHVVTTKDHGAFPYDYAVVATGPGLDWSVPGAGPDGYTECICTPSDALRTRSAWQRLLDQPGPVVVGSLPGAGCIGAAYEFLLNLEDQLRRHGVREKVDLFWLTPEPFLGHFGIGGLPGAERLLKHLFDRLGIHAITNAAIERVEPNVVVLADQRRIDFAFAMLMPPFVGREVVRNSPGVGNARGFVPVRDTYQHVRYPDLFAAGVAIDVPSPFTTPVAVGVPKTGYPADVEAKVVAENLHRLIESGARLKEQPFGQIPGLCVMDAGHKEVVILANHLFPPREHAVFLPNPIYDEGKRLFEKYYLWKIRHGLADLP